MARCTDPLLLRARAPRRALLAAATVGACILTPLSPAALAAKTTTSATAPPVEAAPAQRTRRAERDASAEAAPPPIAVAPPPAEAPPAQHGRRARQNAAAPPPSLGANEAVEPSEAAAAGSAAGDESTQGAQSLARQKKGSSGEKGAGKKQKEKAKEEKTKGKGKNKEAEAESASPAEAESVKQHGAGAAGAQSKSDLLATEAQPAAATTTAAASSEVPTTSPVSGTGDASIAVASPANAGVAKRATRTARRPRRADRAKHDAATAAGALGVLATPAVSPASSAGGSPTASVASRRTVKQARISSTQPALVKTITKIVGVVPAPVRILIGALIALALALGLRSLFSSIRTRRLVRQRGELLEDVGLLQAALLPEPPARLGPVGTSVAYRPADGPGAGGDFYDAFALADGRLAVIVGDVSGHGREALPHTALVRFTVRAYLEAGLEPAEALQTAGGVLERQLADSFATVVAAIYHPRERTLTYATAGHPPPLVLGDPRADGAFERAATVTSCAPPPIGTHWRTGTRQTVILVPGAARICFHTDGVTEARIGDELFGAERLDETLARIDHDAGAAGLLDSVAAQVDARPDDMAACVLRVHGDAGAPVVLSERVELDADSLRRGRLERFLHDSGVEPAAAAALLDEARAVLTRAEHAVLELHFERGAPVASVRVENVIQRKPLAVVRAS
jgi:Stage II sporulation protein E (SpoIIE)